MLEQHLNFKKRELKTRNTEYKKYRNEIWLCKFVSNYKAIVISLY